MSSLPTSFFHQDFNAGNWMGYLKTEERKIAVIFLAGDDGVILTLMGSYH
jgi:hypothetical protein